MSFELVELTLLETDMQIQELMSWRWADLVPFTWYIVGVLDSVFGSRAQRRAKDSG